MSSISEEDEDSEPMDGDWCLVDLSDEPVEEATRVAHALGMNFEQFMHIALEEKLLSFVAILNWVAPWKKFGESRCSNSTTSGEKAGARYANLEAGARSVPQRLKPRFGSLILWHG